MERKRDRDVCKLYRTTTLGSALVNTLQELCNAREIDEHQMEEILCTFDSAVLEKFADLP